MSKPDGAAQFEDARIKLAEGLAALAENMNACSQLAETFADILKHQLHANGVTLVKGTKKRKADALDDDGKKKRQPRKPKDPNAPKRPPSSYIMFQNEIRKELKAKHPDVPNAELLSMIAKMWSELPDEKKATYNQAMASAKEQYASAKAVYDNRSPDEVEAANARTAAAAAAAPAKRTRKPKAAAQEPLHEPTPEPVAQLAETSSSDADSDNDDDSEEEEETVAKSEADEDDEDDEDEIDHEPTPKKAKKAEQMPRRKMLARKAI